MSTNFARKLSSQKKDPSYYINVIRGLAVDIVEGANSGHPGMPLGMAPVAHILLSEFLKFNPGDSQWFDRDRWILSNGHGCALLYAMLHLAGYRLTMDDLKSFRKLHSKTPGHPERGVTDGVEVTTGPLGQGVANGVGMAVTEMHLAARFNKPGHTVIDHFTYVFCGDGCLMEGVAQEALSLAGHWGLEKLIIIYDDNHITIDGNTDLAYTENKLEKMAAFGFHNIVVENGSTDVGAIRAAFEEAKTIRGKPKMIHLRTVIGFGAPLEGTSKVHGAPLGKEGVLSLKKKLGLEILEKYHVPDDVYELYKEVANDGVTQQAAWFAAMERYTDAFPVEAKELKNFIEGKIAMDWVSELPGNDKAIATRKASENALSVIVPSVTNLLGGSADLTSSNLTLVGGHKGFQRDTPEGRYLYYGVREHAMAAISNGIAAHGGCIPFCGTFLNFIGYALGAVRLSALSHLGVIYVATHDGIGLGEDGPTHQPVELAPILRATPNLWLFRPADQVETSAAWALAIENRTKTTILSLSRQNLPPLSSSAEGVRRGAYIIRKSDAAQPHLILIGTGSEVQLCLTAAEKLSMDGIFVNVISMPCTSLFDSQCEAYKCSVLIPGIPVMSVEAWTTFGWSKYANYAIGVDSWGISAPAEQCYQELGITVENIVTKAKRLLEHCQGKDVVRFFSNL